MDILQSVVGAVRRVRTLTMVGERKRLTALVSAPREEERETLIRYEGALSALACLGELQTHAQVERPPGSAVSVAGGVEVFVPLGDEVDLGKLRDVLENRAGKVRSAIEVADKKLSNEKFVSRADPDVVAGERTRFL